MSEEEIGKRKRQRAPNNCTTTSYRVSDEVLHQLLAVIQQALLGADLSLLGQDLSGRYHDAWQEIFRGVIAREE